MMKPLRKLSELKGILKEINKSAMEIVKDVQAILAKIERGEN